MDLRLPGIVLVACCLGQGVGGIPQGFAQDDLGAAKAHYNKASRLYDVGEYRQALEEFKAAHVAKPDPAFLFNIAQCHRQLGELELAVVMYKRFLATSAKAANRSEVERRVAELEATLAAQKNKSPEGEAPAAVTAVPAAVTATDTAPAAVVPSGATATPAALDTSAAPAPPASGSSLRYLRWIGVGVTVALAGGAIATGLSASSKYDDLKGSCGATSAGCSDSDIDGIKSRALLTNVLWGAAGVSAVATGLAFYLAPHGGAVQMAWRF
jgi:hypothetical protein